MIKFLSRKYTIEQLIEAVKISKSYVEVMRFLGLRTAGGNNKTVKKLISQLSLDISHWDPTTYLSGLKQRHGKTISDDEVFIENFIISKSAVKRRFKHKSIYKCSICNSEPIWQDKPLTLQLDHINGNNNDNRLENLRWLCPNCHTQTTTFAGRSAFTKPPAKYCIDCKVEIQRGSARCKPCFYKNGMIERHRKPKIEWPSNEELENQFKLLGNWSAIGRTLGVSGAAVRKHVRKFNEQLDTRIHKPPVYLAMPPKNDLQDLIDKKLSALKIAQQYDVTVKTAYNWLDRYGLKPYRKPYLRELITIEELQELLKTKTKTEVAKMYDVGIKQVIKMSKQIILPSLS